MAGTAHTQTGQRRRSVLDRALSLVSDVRPGEGTTAVLMLVNIFLLLVCYSVIKTVREPLILLGGGAEVRSYAAAGQAVLLMGFVPLYSWFASRVNRLKLIVGVTLYFIACIEVFAVAVAAHTPYVGVAFFIWVGIFNISLVAQFWSFANDIYRRDSGSRLFPVIAIGMTAGAPLGSLVAARLFRLGLSPQLILQVSAVLLAISAVLYLVIDRRETRGVGAEEPMTSAGGFGLVLRNQYLLLVAALVVLLNVVNTTGEYLVARLLSQHVSELALATPGFDKQAFIGAFAGEYQFWVNVAAFVIQAIVTSRLVKHKGLAGALLVLPVIALGGYSLIAAGAGFAMVRSIKTAENATDYSIMNTARQLLWLPATREEKYKAKQAIDTFFVRGGDLLSAGVVYLGTHALKLSVEQFALANVVLTLAWLAVALLIIKPTFSLPRRSLQMAGAVIALLVIIGPAPAAAQDTRAEQRAADQTNKAAALRSYEPTGLERSLARVDRALFTPGTVYPFIGSIYEGGGLAVGPGIRKPLGDSGHVNAFAAYSLRSYKTINATVAFPAMLNDHLTIEAQGLWLDAPTVSYYGTGNNSLKDHKVSYAYRTTVGGATARVQTNDVFAFGGGLDLMDVESHDADFTSLASLDPTYRRTRAFAELDWRTSPDYSRRGGLVRLDATDYHQMNDGTSSFRRVDAEVQQFVPLFNENWVIALRALASTTDVSGGNAVPYALLPSLGGNHMLRGYSPWRFRDNNSLLVSGEYRWAAGPFVDMAVFVDAGKVASRLEDLNLEGMKVTKGVGVSFHTPRSTALRMEVARSAEGTSLIVAFSPSF